MSENGTLKAGAAMADITPQRGIQLAGDIGRYRPMEEVREPIYARALVLELQGKRCCILSLDVLAITNYWAAEIRRRAARRFGLDPASVMIHVVQNHATPCIGHTFVRDECDLFPPEYPWLRGGDDRYNGPAVEATLAAVGRAVESLQPVSASVGRGIDGRVAFNRRFVMRDGSTRTHPPQCSPDILYPEGPADPEVGVMAFTAADGKIISVLLHHTSHPCHGYPHRYVIGDWPGAWSDGLRHRCGEACVPLVLNGCCGNVHHGNPLDPDWVNDHRRMGRLLTETACKVLEHAEPLDPLVLGWDQTTLRLPLRLLTEEEVTAARKLIEEHPHPMWTDETRTAVEWDWVYAASILDLKAAQEEYAFYDYEIQGVRIGEVALLALMGEPFVEGQLRLKLESPAPFTFVAHMCNGYLGYVPTERAFLGGGYETRTSNWSRLRPDALDAIVDESVALVKKLF